MKGTLASPIRSWHRTLIPRSRSGALNILLLFVSVLSGSCSLAYAKAALTAQAPYQRWGLLVMALGSSLFGVGLWRRTTWARSILVFILWIAVFLVPLGVVNPFMASDLGDQAPAVGRLVLIVYSLVALFLLLLHLLQKHKNEFREVLW